MNLRKTIQVGVGAAILAVLVARLGTGPFLVGLRSVSVLAIVVAAAIAVVTTACAAWRWHLAARSLDLELPMRESVSAYYQSQFLNIALPGGVLGDVHRAVRHGLDAGAVPRAGRAVVEERVVGQVVLIALTVGVLAVLPSPIALPMVAVGGFALVVFVAVTWRFIPSAWPGMVLASTVIVIGHAATFVLAVRTVGVAVPMTHLLPLVLLVLVIAGVPLNVGGWGPREGAAVWAFAAAGLGGAHGLAVSTVYGVFTVTSALPGAILLMVPDRRVHGSADLVGAATAHD